MTQIDLIYKDFLFFISIEIDIAIAIVIPIVSYIF